MLIKVEIGDREAFIESTKVIGVREGAEALFLDLEGDERSIKVSHNSLPRLMNMFQPVIPANPGFEMLISAPHTDDYFWFDRVPIIAWRQTEHMFEPIRVGDSIDDFENFSNPWAILCPNGFVEQPFVGFFDNLDAWREAAEKYWQEQRMRVKEGSRG